MSVCGKFIFSFLFVHIQTEHSNSDWLKMYRNKYLKSLIDIDDDCENVDGGPGHKEDDGADN